jgi:hypothetical protein
MLDCNDPIIVGLDEPTSGGRCVSCGVFASDEKPSHNNDGDKGGPHAIIVPMQPRLVHAGLWAARALDPALFR